MVVPIVFFTGEGPWSVPWVIDESATNVFGFLYQMRWCRPYFLRQTPAIDYEWISCEPVSRAMLGLMGLAGRRPYPRDELCRMWRDDAAGRVKDWALQQQFLSFALATSPLSEEQLRELALETGLVDREATKDAITQPLNRNVIRKSDSEGLAKDISNGRPEGMSTLLLSQVRERFGPVPEVVGQQVRSATPSDLEAWARSFVHARSLDEIFGNEAGKQNGRYYLRPDA